MQNNKYFWLSPSLSSLSIIFSELGKFPDFRVLSKYITNLQTLYHTIAYWVQVLFLLIYCTKTLLSFTCSKTMNGFVVVNLEMRTVLHHGQVIEPA